MSRRVMADFMFRDVTYYTGSVYQDYQISTTFDDGMKLIITKVPNCPGRLFLRLANRPRRANAFMQAVKDDNRWIIGGNVVRKDISQELLDCADNQLWLLSYQFSAANTID